MYNFTTYEDPFVTDKEWKMVLESGTVIQTGKLYHVVFKRHILTFRINDGCIELLQKRKVPCSDYKLPLIDNVISFKQRAAVYIERERLQKGREIDDGNFSIYAAS